jgi:hypothetical protein
MLLVVEKTLNLRNAGVKKVPANPPTNLKKNLSAPQNVVATMLLRDLPVNWVHPLTLPAIPGQSKTSRPVDVTQMQKTALDSSSRGALDSVTMEYRITDPAV